MGLFAFSPNTHSAVLIYSNDVQGEIEPCGCRQTPLGGMVRKANLLRSIEDPEQLQVDAGDLFFSSEKVAPTLENQAKVQARFVVEALNRLGHNAVTPGELDFALGLDFFQELREEAKFQFLSANLSLKNGKKLLDSFQIYKRGSIRVGVFGLSGEGIRWPSFLKATSSLKAAKKVVRLLKKKKVDLIVALTHQGLEADQDLARKVKGIDIIVGAHSQSFLQDPIQIGQTTLYQASFQNQYIGVIPLSIPFSGDNHELVALEERYNKPKNSEFEKLVSRFKAKVAETNTKEKNPPSDENHFQTFVSCSSCHIPQFQFWRKTRHANALETLHRSKQLRNKDCLRCHTLGLGHPKGFNHVEQIARCRSGEFIGPEEMTSFLRDLHHARKPSRKLKDPCSPKTDLPILVSLESFDRSWAPVQCENCHGAGGSHPFSDHYTKKVNKTLCLSCHTPERAPAWYGENREPNWVKIDQKVKKIACPK